MTLPRVQAVVLPILRDKFPDATVVSWVPDVDHRDFPIIQVRRVGGARNDNRPELFGMATIELTVFTTEGLPETELLYDEVLEALYEAVRLQTITSAGYLHSIKETMGMTQFSSLFMDSWRVQGLISLGVRPPRST